jgi:hypothetical protein
MRVIEMSGKSIQYWQKKWDNCPKRYPGDITDDNVGKTLHLLVSYARLFKSLPAVLLNGGAPWGGSIGRFFTCRWNSHHGKAIEEVLFGFYHVSGKDAFSYTRGKEMLTKIMGYIKTQIGDTPINKNGDLARILHVVKVNTGMDYFSDNPAQNYRDIGKKTLRETHQERLANSRSNKMAR